MLGVSRMTIYRRRVEFGMIGDEIGRPLSEVTSCVDSRATYGYVITLHEKRVTTVRREYGIWSYQI